MAAALLGLLPWALVVGGVELPPWLFAVMALVPAGYIVVVDDNPGGMFPLMLLVVWIDACRRAGSSSGATIGAAAACIVALGIEQGAHESGMVYFLGGLGISALAGAMLRRQEVLTSELQAMRDLQVEQLAATERTRIAREVHDVVAHSLTIVMLNVTGARRALATQPERADEALARAETVGRESLDSIRQVMGLLRDPGTGLDLPAARRSRSWDRSSRATGVPGWWCRRRSNSLSTAAPSTRRSNSSCSASSRNRSPTCCNTPRARRAASSWRSTRPLGGSA